MSADTVPALASTSVSGTITATPWILLLPENPNWTWAKIMVRTSFLRATIPEFLPQR